MIERTTTDWLTRLHHHDARALGYLAVRRHPRVNQAMRGITRLGDPAVVVLLCVGLLLLTEGTLHAAAMLASVAVAASHVLVQVLKRRVARPRPNLPIGLASLIAAPDRFSFPSGHSAAALAVTAALAPALAPPLAAAVLALGLMVGVSRCYLGVHYPGDVVVGWALAWAGLLLGGLVLPPF